MNSRQISIDLAKGCISGWGSKDWTVQTMLYDLFTYYVPVVA